jgi:hypothetical protein
MKPLIRPGITCLKSTSEYQWLPLKKSIFNFEKDVYMCIAYIPPEGSTYGINVLESIENDVILYRDKDHIILCGDINAKSKCEKDYIENDSNDGINVYDNYSPDFSIRNPGQ